MDRLVVCHGDACCPNTVVGADGRWSGHVDLGALGAADRWADIAVASMSTRWNYGPGWEDALIAAYGIEADRELTRSTHDRKRTGICAGHNCTYRSTETVGSAPHLGPWEHT